MSTAANSRHQKQLARTVYDYGAAVYHTPASRPDGHGGFVSAATTWTWGGHQPASITRADDGHGGRVHTINCTPELFRTLALAAASKKLVNATPSSSPKKRKRPKHAKKHNWKHSKK